jgi:hypothetical protein
MINEKKLKADSMTLGMRDIALTRSISERQAMGSAKKGYELVTPYPKLVLVPFRTTDEMRDKIKIASTKLIQQVDQDLEEDGHDKIDKRARRDQGLSMVTSIMCELVVDYVDNSLDEKEYPHQKKVQEFFEELVIPYLKERRLSRDY